jgi:hypothetical protein
LWRIAEELGLSAGLLGPRHGHAAGRMSRTSHAMLKDNASLPGTRPGNDHAVSRCSGSEAGAGIASTTTQSWPH